MHKTTKGEPSGSFFVAGFSYYNGTTSAKYYFTKNVFGDIISIRDASGNVVGTYTYDAFGNCTVNGYNDVLRYNPFRYRGYVYDQDTKLYFLESRYYCPEWHRFMNPDHPSYIDAEQLNCLDLYAYCGNDPINFVDPTGRGFISTLLLGFAIGSLVGCVAEVAKQIYNSGDWNWNIDFWDWKQIGLSTLGGGVAGAISSIPLLGSAGTFIFGGLGSVLGGLINGTVQDFASAAAVFIIGGIANVFADAVSQNINQLIAIHSSKKMANSLLFSQLTMEDIIGTATNGSHNAIYNKVIDSATKLLVYSNGKWINTIYYSLTNSFASNILSIW